MAFSTRITSVKLFLPGQEQRCDGILSVDED
jgi:hypothetical protein